MTQTPILPIGAYIQADSSGTLPGNTVTGLPREPWAKPAEQLLQRYLAEWGPHVHSIYIRGSVARGLAIPNISDLDSFAVLNPQSTAISRNNRIGTWTETVNKDIQKAFPFLTGIEADLIPMDAVLDRGNFYSFILRTEASCIHGEHLGNQMRAFKLSEANFQTRYFRQHFSMFRDEFPSEPADQRPEFITWIAKRYLRLGMEFVMTHENRYSRDLYLCYKSFAKHYPEQATSMHQTLELALNPKTTTETEAFLYEFGVWLAEEADRILTLSA